MDVLTDIGSRGDDMAEPHSDQEGAEILLAGVLLREVETGRSGVSEDDLVFLTGCIIYGLRMEFGFRNGVIERRGEPLVTKSKSRGVDCRSKGEEAWRNALGLTAAHLLDPQ